MGKLAKVVMLFGAALLVIAAITPWWLVADSHGSAAMGLRKIQICGAFGQNACVSIDLGTAKMFAKGSSDTAWISAGAFTFYASLAVASLAALVAASGRGIALARLSLAGPVVGAIAFFALMPGGSGNNKMGLGASTWLFGAAVLLIAVASFSAGRAKSSRSLSDLRES